MNLSSLAGQTVRVVFRVDGDEDTAAYGWWVDDIRPTPARNAVASVPGHDRGGGDHERAGDVDALRRTSAAAPSRRTGSPAPTAW